MRPIIGLGWPPRTEVVTQGLVEALVCPGAIQWVPNRNAW